MQENEYEVLTVPHDITLRFPNGSTVTHLKGTEYEFKKNLFFHAALHNRVDNLYQFIKLCYPIDSTDYFGFTVLGCAAKSE
ncbi:MAG: hypothetical protein AB7F19_07035 [Candidatus Babeliales bacterium]